MLIFNRFLAGWVAIPGILFIVFDSWVIDYSMPILSLFIGVLYIILFIGNRKDASKQLYFFSASSSLLFGIILLIITYWKTPEIETELSKEIIQIDSSICGLNIEEGIWQMKLITKSLLTIKINFVREQDIAQIRSSPLIFGDRVAIRKRCGA